jgi:RNA polymerase sigma-70 factor (ECF subfamily)
MKLLEGGLVRRPPPPAPRTDSDPLGDLVPAALGGDAMKLARLIEAVTPAVLGVVRAVLGARHADVPDVAQESLIAFRRALHAFRGDSTVTHYARQIALRVATSAQRRSLRRRSIDRRLPADEEARSGPWDEDPALRARRLDAFRELLASLPEAQAESLALRAVLGYSLGQIASETGAPVNTVRSRLRLALEGLRRRIQRDPALREILGDDS